METTKMKIEYRKQIDSETAPWQLLTNMDELLWNGIYNLRVTDDDGTHSLPFRFANDDTVTLVVKDHAHEGMLENGRTIVHTITRVERSTGNVLSYTRTRYNSNGIPKWNYWTLATEDDAVIEIPKATPVSLGAVIIGDGLAVDADGKLSVAGKSIGEECLISALNDKINVAATKANATDLFVQNSGLALHYGALLQDDAPYPGTDLRVHTDKILSGGEQLVVNDGYVISTLKIFDGEQEIAYANNLSESRYTLDAKGLHYQFEFSKLNMTPFTDDELPQVIKAYHRRPIVWSSAHHINHFVAAGTYNIVGQRTNSADGLPIANAASGHSINARLVVLDSSIPASSKESDKCITQVLILSNRVGGDGDIYVRTGRAADTAHLIAGNGWGTWGKLQQNIEVGQTASLDGYVNNGIYSGVYTNGSTLFETFVMVVINNYAVAAATGTARNITQVKYAVDTNGVFCYHVRSGQGNEVVEWGEWHDLDAVTTDRIQDGAVTAEKLSADIRPNVENPLRPLFIAAGAEYNDSGADKTKTAPWGETVTHKAGHYYLNGLGDITEEQMMEIYNAPHNALYEQAYAEMQNIRTLLFCGCSSSVGLNSCINALFLNCSNLEVIGNNSGFFYFSSSVSTIKNLFKRCKKLRIVAVKPFYVNNAMFDSSVFSECSSLEYIRLDRLHFSLSLADCSNITKDSVLYIIQKAIPTSAITITLHPDAYARLANDADIVAALEAQPLVSLVSA
ncbi:MAG: hypothetical protein J6Q48_06150 [Bacteroidaceae bacterium]|nr:hypothetical protein [Bacteroidaceae bacterium]